MKRRRANWSRDRKGETRKQREARLREWLGGQLRQRDRIVPQEVWKRMVELGLVRDLMEGAEGQETTEELVEQARSALVNLRAGQHRARARARRRGNQVIAQKADVADHLDIAAYLKPEELRRAQVLTQAMVRVAERWTWGVGRERWSTKDRPAVECFRARVLGGTLATGDQSERLFQSIGAALFEHEFFVQHDIPVLDHKSELTTGFDWDAPDMRHGLTPRSQVTFRWGHHSYVASLGDRVRTLVDTRDPIFPLWRAQEPCLVMSEASVSGWLSTLSVLLADMCAWDNYEAVLFVLTGSVPAVMPMDVGIPNYSKGANHALMRVELSIHPWVSAEALLTFYKRLQRIAIGPRNRAPTVASLDLFNFVARLRHRGQTYREAMRAWAEAHPADRKRYRDSDPSALRRFTNQFRDIERQVLRPFGKPTDRRIWF